MVCRGPTHFVMSVRTITVKHILGLFVGLRAVAEDDMKRSFIECWFSSPGPGFKSLVYMGEYKKMWRPKFCPVTKQATVD